MNLCKCLVSQGRFNALNSNTHKKKKTTANKQKVLLVRLGSILGLGNAGDDFLHSEHYFFFRVSSLKDAEDKLFQSYKSNTPGTNRLPFQSDCKSGEKKKTKT